MARSRRVFVAALAVVGPFAAAVACNNITGLSEYQKVSCVADCGVGDAPESGATADASPEGSTADAFEGGVGLPDVQTDASFKTYARWPMPNPAEAGTGNVDSYDAGDGSTDFVVDNVTGLVWSRGHSGLVAIDAGACTGTWRLPTRIELVSLLDYTKVPAIDPALGYDAGVSAPFWTLSPVADAGGSYWTVDFASAAVSASSPALAYARCVQGPLP